MCSAHTSSTARYWEVATGLARAARSQCVTTESALTPDSPPACLPRPPCHSRRVHCSDSPAFTRGEAIFFNELRPHVKLRSPTGYFAAADSSNGRSIVLMEDLAVQGWTFPDPMQDRIGERDAIDMTEQMATYHAAFWDGRQAGTAFKQLPTPLQFQNNVNRLPGFVRQFHRGLQRSRELLPAALWAQRDRLWPAFMRSLEISSAGTPTLLHQDLHQGNWLRDPDGRMGSMTGSALLAVAGPSTCPMP